MLQHGVALIQLMLLNNYMITPSRRRPVSSLSCFIMSVSAFVSCKLSSFFLKLVGGLDFKSSITFDPDTTYLFLSNHQSRLDPFTTYGALPSRELWGLLPTRPLTAKPIYYSPLYLWLKSMGCYPTKNRAHTVPQTVDFLERGFPVFLFPEGRRTLQSESNPKDGTRLILDEIRRRKLHVKIILVHIEWHRPYHLFRKATIRVEEAHPAIYHQDMPDIMRMIYEIL